MTYINSTKILNLNMHFLEARRASSHDRHHKSATLNISTFSLHLLHFLSNKP